MANIMLSIPEELDRMMKRYPEIRWDEIARKAIWEYSRKLAIMEVLTEKSRLTEADVDEIDKVVKRGLSEQYIHEIGS